MIYPIEIKGKTKKQVTKLNLSGCNLTSIPENVFEYTNLTKLVLCNNNIKFIPADIQKLKKLKVLDLANNEIRILHSAVFRLPKLRTLNVYGNLIKRFPKQVYESNIQKLIVGKTLLEDTEIEKLLLKFDVVTTKAKSLASPEVKKELPQTKAVFGAEIKYEMEKQQSIFISYSHKDANWLQRVKTHLKPLGRYYDIDEWDDQKLRPSDKWEEEISKAMNKATIAVLLFSAEFMASDFIYKKELQPLLEKAEKHGTRIIPIMVSPCAILEESGLGKYQAINAPERTLVEMDAGEVERTLTKLVDFIKSVIKKRSHGSRGSDTSA